jgi:dolichol-phosphate mannosyltransferase
VVEVSIIIPTYNEAQNIEELVKKIANLGLESEIIVVDDNSPDKTGKIAESLKKDYKNLKVIHRTKKGLASAVVEGFRASKGETLGVLDADFSHPLNVIPNMLEPIKTGKAELVIGSRYIKGGKIEGWNLVRKITSKGAILLSRPLTGIKDSVSGFFFLKKEVINEIDFNPKGYKIGLEVIVKGKYDRVVEIPYTFTNRKSGTSKLGIVEYFNYILHISKLYRYKIGRLI